MVKTVQKDLSFSERKVGVHYNSIFIFSLDGNICGNYRITDVLRCRAVDWYKMAFPFPAITALNGIRSRIWQTLVRTAVVIAGYYDYVWAGKIKTVPITTSYRASWGV